MMVDQTVPQWVLANVNMAQPRLGAKVIAASDDFFADKARLISPEEPVFKPDVYDDNGKWMDGWESRRKRGQGHDHAIIALGQMGEIAGVEIDTRHFTGNYPRAASVEVAALAPGEEINTAVWQEILPPQPLTGDSRHFFANDVTGRWTHIRLNIYPDGGVARLRVYGRITKDWQSVTETELVDLAAMENGGRGVIASDEHFGTLSNIIAPGNGMNMGDGWETRRRREPGFDWGILKLGHIGIIRKVEIDTAFFKGNFAYQASIHAGRVGNLPDMALPALSIYWDELLSAQSLSADNSHIFNEELQHSNPVDHLRINMIPDGGISRLRIWGHIYNKDEA